MQRAHPLRLSVVGVVVARAEHVGAHQNAPLHLGTEALPARRLVERAHVAVGGRHARAVAHAVVAGQVGGRLGRGDDVVGRDGVARCAAATPRTSSAPSSRTAPRCASIAAATPACEIGREVLPRQADAHAPEIGARGAGTGIGGAIDASSRPADRAR